MQPCESEEEFENAFVAFGHKGKRIVLSFIENFSNELLRREYRFDESRILERQYGTELIIDVCNRLLTGRSEKHLELLLGLSRIYWITDSGVVGQVLRRACKNNEFPLVMIPFFNTGSRRGYGSSIGQIPNSSKKRGNSAMNFFLHHANKARLEFNGVRFQDLRLPHPYLEPPLFGMHYLHGERPVFSAAENIKPHLLLLLLRYGAKIKVTTNSQSEDRNIPEIFRFLIEFMFHFSDDGNLQKLRGMRNHPAAQCLNILLRVIPQIRMGDLNFPLMELGRGSIASGSVCSHDYIRLLSEEGIVPEFVNRYLEPSRLTHLCRCVIRERLNSSWNLPYGVNLLPQLPITVKNYLSIVRD